jgi:hypothetical protein
MDWIDWLAVAVGAWFVLSVTLTLALARMLASAIGAVFSDGPVT